MSIQVLFVFSFLLLCGDALRFGGHTDCDVAVIGSGIGGLCAGAILSAVYGQRVQVYETHYLAGGCAHSFPARSKTSSATYKFDSGPSILLGCSTVPLNPLMQVFRAVGAENAVDWIRYTSWGMRTEDGAWDFELGEGKFDSATGPISRFSSNPAQALREFKALREACAPLCAGAASIPTMTLRGDRFKVVPLLPHLEALKKVVPYADALASSFQPFLEEHVRDPWLRAWLDALAFSLSGLPASKTGAAAMAYTLFDLHRTGAALDYPRGGMGAVVDALVRIIEDSGGSVHLNCPVKEIIVDRGRARGVKLARGPGDRIVHAKRGVICNAPVWSLPQLLSSSSAALNDEQRDALLVDPSRREKTKSFLHLHLGLDATGLDVSRLRAHYTVMHRGLLRSRHSTGVADPCSDRNMVAVSNPSILDDSLVDQPGKLNIHAYGAGNEPFENWSPFVGNYKHSPQYRDLKSSASSFLYQSVGEALGIDEQEVRDRAEIELIGTPLTHMRFLRGREDGTYGAAWGSMLSGPLTPLPGLLLCGDSTFPGIGVPAVAVSGANCANTMVSVLRQMLAIK